MQNVVTRSMMVLVLLVLVGYLLIGAIALLAGLSLGEVVGLSLIVLAIGVSVVGTTTNWRTRTMATTYWAGATVTVAIPGWGLETLAVSNLVGTIGMEVGLRRWPASGIGGSREHNRLLLRWF